MNELIRIQTSKGGKQVVSARELHSYLGISSDFTTWCKRMFEYGFRENEDYAFIIIGEPDNEGIVNPNPKTDCILTIDTAKEISMIQRSEKGKQARQYFIEIEKRYILTSYKLPETYADALRQLAEKVEEKELMQKQLAAQKPAVEFFEAVTSSADTMDMAAVAKILKTGRNRLFAFLRESGILIKNADSLPYQQYIDAGYFGVVETKFNKPDGTVHIGKKVVVYQKGVNYIQKRLKKYKNN